MSLLRLCRPRPRLQHPNTTSSSCRVHSITTRGLTEHAHSTPLAVSSSSCSSVPAVDQNKLRLLKHPSRGGQDLSKRYQRLERSIRGKTSYGRGIEDFERSRGADPAPYTTKEDTQEASTATGKASRHIYRGFVVPEVPKPPADDGTSQSCWQAEWALTSVLECCMSGCAVCVYDAALSSVV